MEKSRDLKRVAMTSSLIAMAIVLELLTKLILPYLRMPFGGNFIGIAMLPLVLIGFLFGLKYGIAAGFVYGIYEIILAPSGHIVGWSFLLDYLVGFTAFGLTGFFVGHLRSIKHVIYGVLLAGFIRYLSVSFAGVIFWRQFMPAGRDPWYYSFVLYNLGYNASTTMLTLLLLLLIKRRVSDLSEDFIGLPSTS